MNNNDFPYVLSDCDGTITDFDFTILPSTIESIQKYQQATNGKFSFITGRLDVACRKIFNQLKIKTPVISCNGALITNMETQEIIFASYLDAQMCYEMFILAHENQIDLSCYEPNKMHGTVNSDRIMAWKEYCDNQENETDKFEIVLHPSLLVLAHKIKIGSIKPVQLIIKIKPEQTLSKLLKTTFSPFQKHMDFVQSTPTLANAINIGVNKFSGLKKFADIVDCDWKEICTFGDQMNDFEMINEVKYGYCMGNGVEGLKAVAFKTIESLKNNGVGQQLEVFLKKER